MRRLTDGTGMLQHSRFSIPDRDHGYCIDDNARALLLLSWADDLPLETRIDFGAVYAAFVQHAWNVQEKRFRNFMGFDRQWLEAIGSDDSNGRTYWALAITETEFPDDGTRRWAATLLDQIASKLPQTSSPRTAAFLILGAELIIRHRENADEALQMIRNCAAFLMECYAVSAIAKWPWFETSLAYDNARLPEALFRAGAMLDDADMIEVATRSMNWLMDRQVNAAGQFRPVATQDFGRPHAPPTLYDQQPLEAWATVDACMAAASVDNSRKWRDHAEAAFAWFLGANDTGKWLVDEKTGECFDGINSQGLNLNRGAESVLAWQCACRRIAVLRKMD